MKHLLLFCLLSFSLTALADALPSNWNEKSDAEKKEYQDNQRRFKEQMFAKPSKEGGMSCAGRSQEEVLFSLASFALGAGMVWIVRRKTRTT